MQKEKKEKHFIQKPQYPGGLTAMRAYIRENLKYPKAALDAKVEGTVVLHYNINFKGIVTDVRVISGLGYGCDEEATRLVKELKFEVPKTRKVKVKFQKTIQIHFRLPKPKASKSPQVTYTLTSKKSKEEEKPDSNSYFYTIDWNT